MSQLFVDNIKGRTGGAIGAPAGAVVTGIVTATELDINGDADIQGNLDVGGVLTYEDVTNVDSVGIITAQQGIRVGAGQSIGSDGAAVVYYGDGSNLDGVVSGVEVKENTASRGTSITSLDFSGATVTASGTGSTITIAAGGITTAYQTPSANALITLDLGAAQYHDIRLTAGITTITCTGGTAGDSHSVVLTQPSSGITTVGFSSYFKFPSGSFPALSEGASKIDLVSFVIRRQGATGVSTELLASAGLNYLSQV
jgi:hypothetical protein|tara:strand:+ start:10 stop:777 length:768 start_codon:yes stop_codon:yes gene_type:complete